MAPETLPAREIWAKTVDAVKMRVNNRSLWEAMENSVGITAENGVFVVGMDAYVLNQAGHMLTSDHKNAIERVVSELAGSPLRFRVIEGTTMAEWEATRERESRSAAAREATYQKRSRQEEASHSFDDLMETITRSFQATPLRTLPQSRARFLNEMVRAISETMDRVCPGELDEQVERVLARVIERLAVTADVPPTVAALELERYRATRVK